jgi:hypothetical protein
VRAAIVLVVLGACIGQTPDDRARDAVVSVGRHGPTHNPGSPCLLCHDFALAGTIYQRATDDNGVVGATVTMTDAAGRSFSAVSNETGNFYVTVDSSLSEPQPTDQGEVRVPWSVIYPVHVEVTAGGATKKMRNAIHQWGSCASCHTPDPGATSNGRVYVEGTP